jgi:2-oxoglutarate dehydrogenase E1 component
LSNEAVRTAAAVWDAFRRWGYLQARLDPLGRLKPWPHPELDTPGPQAEEARGVYCGPIGVEFMHLPYPDRCAFVRERMEASSGPVPDRARLLDLLVRADTFEQVLQRRYLGTKRYSAEGATALLIALDEIFRRASAAGVEKVVLGMTHRGRLNVMANLLGMPAEDLFAFFEDVDPQSVLGGGDVKYHLGATGAWSGPDGRPLPVTLVPNPSHLEAVDPVVVGLARAEQDRRGGDRRRVLPVLVHGDAAFAGQGILAETLNLADLPGYTSGGTVHVIVNNLIGFTAPPEALHSSRHASDAARRLPIPIFHVNGEEPEAVARAAAMAADYRAAFRSDVVLDLIGYRRHGHSEVEDPTVSQPLLYGEIAKIAPLWKSYAGTAGFAAEEAEARAGRARRAWEEAQERAEKATRRPSLYRPGPVWAPYSGGPRPRGGVVETGAEPARLRALGERLAAVPEGFAAHPKILQLLQERRRMARGERPVDWAMAEALAFALLAIEGTRVRLSGQDSRRGTFNQRHAVFIDVRTGAEYAPLANLDPGQAPVECFDSPLSEAGVLGFEYGYSLGAPDALVLWEAQFGDFANGAQVLLDQFVSSAEDKWGVLSGLVLLLPHGYEGQGPEHSSARVERFLQLAAEDNWQVCQPTTAAQYFHLLRRQALQTWRKPLVIFTPKSLLRHPAAASPLEALARGGFRPVLAEEIGRDTDCLLLGSGKIVHELRQERDRRGLRKVAIAALEELYPFPEEELSGLLAALPPAAEVVWVQEEPANMGALSGVWPALQRLAAGRRLRSVKRAASASPATGSAGAHRAEQAALLSLAFLGRPSA